VWASVGSDSVNLRSWTHDSELSCAVIDAALDDREPRVLDRFGDGALVFARQLRLQLAREHLDRDETDDADLLDPISAFAAFRDSAQRLQRWHDEGSTAQAPPGRLRPYAAARLTRRTLAWVDAAVPDHGRPRCPTSSAAARTPILTRSDNSRTVRTSAQHSGPTRAGYRAHQGQLS
jgi:hypothetical protein